MAKQAPSKKLPVVCSVKSPKSCVRADYTKHNPVKGMKKEKTIKPNPARYFDEATIEKIERATISSPASSSGRAVPEKKEYLRNVGAVIGWDNGQDATWSFVECSGPEFMRQFHGRPMNDTTAGKKAKP